MNRKISCIFLLLTVAATIAGCSMFGDDEKSSSPNDQVKRVVSKTSGPDNGLLNTWFGLNAQPGSGRTTSGAGISVNGFLWRAALDTISFMPLAQADPFGGVILTDWYRPPETESERFKVNVYILDSELRADGLRVSVFRQRRDTNNTWVNAKVNADTGTNLENAILKRARQMRVTRQ
jgi:hypothetical protein